MRYQIVPMEQQHIERLAEIERACFHAPWSEHALQEELDKGIFLVALDEQGVPAGYVGCQTVLDEGYITNVAVCPEYRRQGIAGQLLQELADRAVMQKLAFVTLEVRASNAPARTAPMSPGAQVAATASTSALDIPASQSACSVTRTTASICPLDAISGTTPP